MAGMADSEVVEAFRSGVGKVSMSELKKRGVDVHDLEILKKHWKELSR
jgi:hypothetical protein